MKWIVIAVFMLGGCAAESIKDLKESPHRSEKIVIEQNYQRTYKNLLDKVGECFSDGFGGMFVRHVLLSDLRTASISYVHGTPVGNKYFIHIEITAIDNDRSSVDAYVYFQAMEKYLRRIPEWAIDPSAECK